jgi:hypothetical protein
MGNYLLEEIMQVLDGYMGLRTNQIFLPSKTISILEFKIYKNARWQSSIGDAPQLDHKNKFHMNYIMIWNETNQNWELEENLVLI